jgi:hypothetical protein
MSLRVGCLFAVALAQPAYAATVTLAWDPNPEADIAGYVIFYGTEPGVYTTRLDVGNRTSQSITGLADGARYYFAVQAYDTAFLYSALSQAISAETFVVDPSCPPLMLCIATDEGPSLTCPAPVAVSPQGNPVPVTVAPTVSNAAEPVTITCTPESGSPFPVGVTPVTCVALDSLERTASCSTAVLVKPASNPWTSLTMTKPTGRASFVAHATVPLAAAALDSDGTILRVEFYADSTFIGNGDWNGSEYTFEWTNVAPGNYHVLAKATDGNGFSVTSAALDVSVSPEYFRRVPPTWDPSMGVQQ